MATPSSNAVAQVTISDQDLLSTAQQNLVQRNNATVIFPVQNALVYSGYQLITLGTFTALLPFGNFSPFVYIRNANDSGSNVLIVQIQPQGAVSPTAVNLLPGGIFLYGNTTINTSSPFSALSDVELAVFVGAPATAEYMIAY